MNAKIIIAIAAFALVFTGVMAASCIEETDADGTAPGTSEGTGSGSETPVSYTIQYKVGLYTYSVSSSTASIVLKSIEDLGAQAQAPEHKTFTAWTYDGTTYAAGSTYVIPAGTPSDTGIVFTATFTDTLYTVTFKAADGTTIGTPAQGAYGASLTVPAAPAIEGKIFAGWLADGAERPIASDAITTIGGTVTYTATYVIDYKITFIDGDKTFQTCISAFSVPDVGERTGFTFLGWYTADGVQILDPATYAYTADTTLTAKWEPVNCYVTFVAGEGYSVKVAVLYGETVVVPELPEGYVAWDFDFSTPITEDITVSAVAAAPAKATGLSDPVTMTIVIIVGALALAGVAGFVVLIRKGKIVIGRGPKAVKTEEEKKE